LSHDKDALLLLHINPQKKHSAQRFTHIYVSTVDD